MKIRPEKLSLPSGKPGKAAFFGIVRIVLIYAVFAGLWILVSDKVVGLVFSEPADISLAGTLKGLVFVAVTSLLLFVLLARFAASMESYAGSGHANEASRDDFEGRQGRTRLTDPSRVIVVFLLLTVVIAAIGATSFYFLYKSRYKYVNEQLTAVADLKARQLEDWLEERRIDIREFVSSSLFSEAFREWLDSRSPQLGRQLVERLESTRNAHSYAGVELLDLQGMRLLSSAGSTHKGTGIHEDLVRQALNQKEPVFVDLHREGEDGPIHLAYLMAIRDTGKSQQPIGVAVFTIDPGQYLYPLIQSWPTPSATGETVIVRREGEEIVFLNELRHRNNTALRVRFPLSKQDLPGARALLHGPHPYEGRDYRGVPVLTASRRVAGTPWMLGAKIDREEALRDINMLALAGSILTLTAILVSGLLLGQAWRKQRLNEALARAEQECSIDKEREATVEFLRLVNESNNKGDMVRTAATFFQQQSGCEAVGIRLREENDYPYYEARGFPAEFVQSESRLCTRDEAGRPILDSIGDPVLECMCGNVICGRFDESKPFFTSQGSFWTGSTTELLATTTEADRQSRTRNRCHGEGYESVALIALRVGEKRLGLLQLNDRRKGRFSPEVIALWERLAGYLAVALAKFEVEEELRASERLYRSLFNNMLNGFAYCRMLFEQDQPRDFIYLSVNHAFENLTGLKDVVGRRVTEVIPGIRESDPKIFEIYGRVSLTGQPERFEVYVKALQEWFWISVYSPRREHFVAVFDVITDRKRAEETLFESERKYRSLVDNALVGVYRTNLDGAFLYVNDAMVRIFECDSVEEMLADHVLSRYKNLSDRETFIGKLKDKGAVVDYEIEVPTKTGKDKTIIINAVLEGDVISGMVMDITEQKKLEAQLRQAQKMEAIGTLAGGIAHDFNNILSAIIGYGHLLRMKIREDDPLRMNVEQILEAGDRATTLTRSLLAFSRNQIISVKPVELNGLIMRVENFLRRIIGEDISVQTVSGDGRVTVMADSGQIEQVLMNLAVNARDAMPHGGTFTLESGCVELDESFADRHGYGKPGKYALLTATDNGEGMDEETRRRIFEPFFTTKELGRGTGLGLSMVYGIVKQHNGYIDVYSEPGRGSAFKIYLPLADVPEETKLYPVEAPTVSSGGTETILLGEDDASLRKLARIVLEEAGYIVIAAEDGEEAVQKFIEHKDEVKLVILDMIMPKKSGWEAYEQIRNIRPDAKVIFVSGYTADKVHRDGMLKTGFELLLKPVSPRDLLKKVRQVLDA